MGQLTLADIRFACNTPSNSSAAIVRAVRLGHSRVLAEALFSPGRGGKGSGTIVFAPHHIPEYQKLWEMPLSDWMINCALDQGLDYPDELGAIRKEVVGLEQLWVLCRIQPAQLDDFLDALSLEPLGSYQQTVFVLPNIHQRVDMPYPVCSPDASAQIRLCKHFGASAIARLLTQRRVFCLERNAWWSSYRREVMV